MAGPDEPPARLVAGRISKPHGVKGEVAVDVRTDDPDTRFVVGAVLHTEPESAGPLQIATVRSHQGRLLVRFEGHHDRDSVEPIVGARLLVEPGTTDDPDAFYDHELVGLAAVAPDGTVLGQVRDVLHHPGHELLEILRPAGGPVLVPFVAAIVPSVDLAAGRLVVVAPPGLLDDEPEPDGATDATDATDPA